MYVVFAAVIFAGGEQFSLEPVSDYVLLGEDGNFSCVANTTSAYWAINDSSNISTDILQEKTQTRDGLYLTMVIPGEAKYNNSLIQCCLFVYGRGQSCSDAVVFVVHLEGTLLLISALARSKLLDLAVAM